MAPRPQSHRAAGERRRAQLLDAAITVIVERGVQAATHRAIAAAAGVPLSSTSYFFESIDELITAAMDLGATRLLADIQRLADAPIPDGTPVEALIDRYLELLIGETAAATGETGPEKIAQLTLYLQCRHNPALQPLAERLITTYNAVSEDFLTRIGVRDPAFRARVIMAFIDGAALQNTAWNQGAEGLEFFRQAIRSLIAAGLPAHDVVEPSAR